jgi:hypothetical protein
MALLSWSYWHKKRMKKVHNDGLLDSLDFDSFDTCEPCILGKMTRTLFIGTAKRASDLLELIHTDVCGPMSIATGNGYRYFTFIDDLSRYGYIYLMKHNDVGRITTQLGTLRGRYDDHSSKSFPQ